MPIIITETDKKRFAEIRKSIIEIGPKESSFIKIEQLFYETITICRNCGAAEEENKLLALFKNLESGEYYQNTKTYYRKSSQREQAIKKFINQFKIALAIAIKN